MGGFDIAYSTAYFGNYDVGFGYFGVLAYKPFGLVGNVGDNLHGLTEIFALAFLFDYFREHLSRSEIGILVEIFVYKPLVVTEVEVGFRAVVRNVNLAVLNGIHSAGVNVHIRVEFLRRHLIAPEF